MVFFVNTFQLSLMCYNLNYIFEEISKSHYMRFLLYKISRDLLLLECDLETFFAFTCHKQGKIFYVISVFSCFDFHKFYSRDTFFLNFNVLYEFNCPRWPSGLWLLVEFKMSVRQKCLFKIVFYSWSVRAPKVKATSWEIINKTISEFFLNLTTKSWLKMILNFTAIYKFKFNFMKKTFLFPPHQSNHSYSTLFSVIFWVS